MESEYVSMKLNNWIDLIFGYKQRNEEAEAADNLFYPMTYDHNLIDTEANVFIIIIIIKKEMKYEANITQILEYGQVPKQLFLTPQEEMQKRIKMLQKENERLEKNHVELQKSKEVEKEKLIKEFLELDNKKKETINKLKENLQSRELEYQNTLNNLVEQNKMLKDNFNNFDKSKDEYYDGIIQNLKNSHQEDVDL